MIVMLTQCFPSQVGGIESLMSNLALGLSKKNQVIVLADSYNSIQDEKYDKKIEKNFSVRRTGGLKFFRRRNKIKELKSLILAGDITCVIGDSWKSFELCIDLLNKNQIPSICLTHGNDLLRKNNKNKIVNILNKCRAIISNSDYTLSLVKELGVVTTSLKKIYPGASSFEDIKIKEIQSIKGYPIIFTLARLEKRKGHIHVLKCIDKLRNEYNDLKYIIAGNGPELKNLKQLVAKYELNKHVIFLGNVDDSEKKFIFSISDLMVMPTVDEKENYSIEGFGISYIESALHGIPAIASNVGGTKEAVLHDKTGIIIDKIDQLEEALRDLLSNKDKRLNFGKEAKKRALNEFMWDKITNEYMSLIKSF